MRLADKFFWTRSSLIVLQKFFSFAAILMFYALKWREINQPSDPLMTAPAATASVGKPVGGSWRGTCCTYTTCGGAGVGVGVGVVVGIGVGVGVGVGVMVGVGVGVGVFCGVGVGVGMGVAVGFGVGAATAISFFP